MSMKQQIKIILSILTLFLFFSFLFLLCYSSFLFPSHFPSNLFVTKHILYLILRKKKTIEENVKEKPRKIEKEKKKLKLTVILYVIPNSFNFFYLLNF